VGSWSKKNIFFLNRFRSVSIPEKKNYEHQSVKMVKLGEVKEGGSGKNFIYLTYFNKKVNQDKKIFMKLTVKMIKLRGVNGGNILF
jgi:hypothetical protein